VIRSASSVLSDTAILVFAKFPEPGRVKTRLAREVGHAAALRLYRAFVGDLLDTLRQTGHPVAICHDPPPAGERMRDWLGPGYAYRPQNGADLGERMANALSSAFREGRKAAVLVGTDLPDLPGDIPSRAFAGLERTGAAIGPSPDGGYYLIGFAADAFRADVFRDIPWSTEVVFSRTRARMAENGLSPALLPVWNDIDTLADLAALSDAAEAPRTRARLAAGDAARRARPAPGSRGGPI
jgi:hypothetical protein